MFQIILTFLFASSPLLSVEEKPIVILTTSYNNRQWVRANIASIFNQEYSNYRIIYVDDASQDGTADIVESFVNAQAKKIDFQLIRNPQRAGALFNIYHAIHGYCKDDEIIVSLDGDDWFFNNQVLKQINAAYCSGEIWLTHGTLVEHPNGSRAWSQPIPPQVVADNAFRTYRCPSHLRTFYAWLFKKIRLEDLLYEGNFFAMTWDQAMMFPMIEMARERHTFIPDIMYVYNVANPANDNKVNPQLQRNLEAHIRSMPPYERLESIHK